MTTNKRKALGPRSWPAWSDTTAGGFEILRHGDISIAAKPSGDKELTTLQKDWTITSWDTGFVSIPSTPFGDDIAPSIQIYVEAPDFDTIPQDSLLQHLPAPACIVELEFTIWEQILRNWYWWLSIIALFVILYVLYRKYDKLRRVSTFGLSPLNVRQPSSLAWAINSLDTILLNQPWKHAKAKEAHVEASLAIRRFIEDHYKIRATESTTKELQFLMNGSAVPAEWQQRLIQLLNQSDIIKYAKGELPDSTHQSMFGSIATSCLTTSQSRSMRNNQSISLGMVRLLMLLACIVGWLVIQDFENNIVWSSRWGILGLTVLVIHIAVRIFQWDGFDKRESMVTATTSSHNRKPKGFQSSCQRLDRIPHLIRTQH